MGFERGRLRGGGGFGGEKSIFGGDGLGRLLREVASPLE